MTSVTLLGAKSPNRGGHIVGVERVVKVKYNDGIIEFKNLIAFAGKRQNNSWMPICEKGDSGAIVVDSAQKILGLNFAKDDQYSYAIPITSILANLNKKLA
jgi:hypothetical protein